ncbi:MAG: CPBP family intramembrane metalloprotease [Spirochaetales bacterium]|nr:CPBP family intramembrane metalloprotease [Spirochaetales bacterium]
MSMVEPDKKKSIRSLITEMALVFLLFIPFPIYFIPGAVGSTTPSPIQMVVYIIMAVPQMGLLVYILSLQKVPLPAYGIKKPRWSSLGWALIGLGGAFISMSAVAYASYLLPEGVRESLFKQAPFAITSPEEIPLMIAFCIFVGYREELLFRSYLIPRLGELGVKPVWAIVGTSLVFGLAHWNQGLLGVAATALIGASFGVIFVLRKDLHAVAWGHALYDIGVFLLMLVRPYFEQFLKN